MIPYPGIKLALKQANGDRSAARGLMRAAVLADAERQAAIAGLSMNCEYGKHADQRYGCKNDGSGCICECHDQPATPYTEQKTTNG